MPFQFFHCSEGNGTILLKFDPDTGEAWFIINREWIKVTDPEVKKRVKKDKDG